MDQPIRVVLAEDQELIRKSLASLLRETPRMVVAGEAANGKALIEFLRSEPADIVLLDVEMPVMNGLKAIEILGQRFPKTKVIMLSQHNEMGLVYELMLLGARAYLPKGCDVDTLMKAIVTVHDFGYYFDGHVSNALLKGSMKSQAVNPLLSEKALSAREMEILQRLCNGLTNKEIAAQLHITVRTVDFHRANVYAKTGSANLAGLLRFSLRNGLVSLEV